MKKDRAALRALVSILCRLGRRVHGGENPRDFAPNGSDVSGQDELIRQILSTIHNNSILLCGEPGTGKTSLLLQLKERLSAGGDPATEFFPVMIDLHDVPERLLFATVADAVTQQLAPMGLWCRMQATEGPAPDYSHRDLANDFRRVIHSFRDRTCKPMRLVLLVDGVDRLNSYHPRTNQKVRSLFMASMAENLVMVASAVDIDKRWEQEGSPWYNFFEEIELSPAKGEQWRPG